MKDINALIRDVSKKFKSGEIKLGVEFSEIPRLKFDSPKLNYMTYGGLPIARIIEFSGAEGSGKTTTALNIVAAAQKQFPEQRVLFIDVEATYDPYWAKKMGVDSENLVVYRPDSQDAEEVMQTVLKFIETGMISLVVLDSIPALISGQQNDKEIGEKTYGGISQLLTTFCQKLTPLLTRTQTTFIGINQLRDDLGNPHGGTKTPGGRYWKHACSVRLLFRKGAFFDEKGNQLSRGAENPSGNLVNVYLEKSKVFKSNRRVTSYPLHYLDGIDNVSDLIDLAVKYEIIEQAGAWFKMQVNEEELKLQGKAKVSNYLKENKDVYISIEQAINEKIKD